MSTEQKIIDAMRGSDVPHWTTKLLAARTGVSAAKVRETVQSMRWSGKMLFDRLELAPSLLGAVDHTCDMAPLAAIPADPPAILRDDVQPLEVSPTSAGEAIAIALGEDLDGATHALKTKWPRVWWRVVQRARLTGERPGATLAELVEIGLDSLLADAR